MAAIDELKEREKRVVALAGGNAELWETMAARLAAAEKRLATPVRLPKTNGYWTEQEKAFEEAITLAKREIRIAGFKVEGDE
ncbi:hypothetical protein AL485_25225 [Serratia liquefaciens]|nr:hypothetical protein AL485_25225 [Serratia liquefaciens]